MGRCAIEVKVILLDVFAMITFAVGQPEQAFLEDRVISIPESQCEAETLFVVGYAREAILPPVVGTRSCMIVWKVVPGIPILAVIFTDSAPLSFAEVRTPFFPRGVWLD
jgi:hypothetical protein